MIDQHFGKVMVIGTILVILGFVAIVYIWSAPMAGIVLDVEALEARLAGPAVLFGLDLRHQDDRRRTLRSRPPHGLPAGADHAAEVHARRGRSWASSSASTSRRRSSSACPSTWTVPRDRGRRSTRAFVRNLLPLVDIPVVFWDERLSTVAVTRTLIEAGYQPQEARRTGGQDGGGVHPAGCARPDRPHRRRPGGFRGAD